MNGSKDTENKANVDPKAAVAPDPVLSATKPAATTEESDAIKVDKSASAEMLKPKPKPKNVQDNINDQIEQMKEMGEMVRALVTEAEKSILRSLGMKDKTLEERFYKMMTPVAEKVWETTKQGIGAAVDAVSDIRQSGKGASKEVDSSVSKIANMADQTVKPKDAPTPPASETVAPTAPTAKEVDGRVSKIVNMADETVKPKDAPSTPASETVAPTASTESTAPTTPRPGGSSDE